MKKVALVIILIMLLSSQVWALRVWKNTPTREWKVATREWVPTIALTPTVPGFFYLHHLELLWRQQQ